MTDKEFEAYKDTLKKVGADIVQTAIEGLYEDYSYFQNALQNLKIHNFQNINEYYKEVQSLSTIIVDSAKKIDIAKGVLRGKKKDEFVGENLHIEVHTPRLSANEDVLERKNYNIAYDLKLNKEYDRNSLLMVYAKAYNETGALVCERGSRVKVKNIVIAIQNATGLNYPVDFEIFNYSFVVEKDDNILDEQREF